MTRPTSDDEFSDLLLALRFGDEPGARTSAHAALVYVQNLRAAVRAADAMARALLDKSSGAHECNGGPERCWYCADAESDRAVVSAFDQARAKGDV